MEGLMLACRKRPISASSLDGAVVGVESAIMQMGLREIPSLELGRLVLEALKGLDPVAYLRFASVYHELESAEAFLELVRAVTTQGKS